MSEHTAFALFECGLARTSAGQSCSTLRELLVVLRTAPTPVLEHHLMRCVLDDHFEMHEFPNDLARWAWDGLGDHVLGERLGLIDPYRLGNIATLRAELIDLIEHHLWSSEGPVWNRPGPELHLIASRLVTYDTGERIRDAEALAAALPRVSQRSLFVHVHEARRRTGGQTDDFSAWLEARDADPDLVSALRQVDFYFLNLSQLREAFRAVFARFLPALPRVGSAA